MIGEARSARRLAVRGGEGEGRLAGRRPSSRARGLPDTRQVSRVLGWLASQFAVAARRSAPIVAWIRPATRTDPRCSGRPRRLRRSLNRARLLKAEPEASLDQSWTGSGRPASQSDPMLCGRMPPEIACPAFEAIVETARLVLARLSNIFSIQRCFSIFLLSLFCRQESCQENESKVSLVPQLPPLSLVHLDFFLSKARRLGHKGDDARA